MDILVLGLILSASTLLSASGAFLLGFYLKYQGSGEMKKANPFRILVIILSIPIILISSSALLITEFSFSNSDHFLIFISISSLLIPPIAYFGILIFKR